MAATPKPDWAASLIDLLDHQRAVIVQLYALCRQQAPLVQEGDAQSLLLLLGQRQQLITRLSQANAMLEPYKRNWPRFWSELDEPTRRSVGRLVDEVQGMLDRIVEQDNQDRQSLARQCQEMSGGLQQISRGTAVNRAYGDDDRWAGRNRFTDQEG